MKLIHLTFVDPKPDDRGKHMFRGATIVKASNQLEAVAVAVYLGISPGGTVFANDVPKEVRIPERYIEKLLTKEELDQLDQELGY